MSTPRTDDERLLRRAFAVADAAVAAGERPFGAVLARGGVVVAEAHNTVASDGDPTQHAELRLVSQAARTLGLDVFGGATLYASTEPCEMCAGAISRAGIRRLVFGCRDEVLSRFSGRRAAVPASVVLTSAAEPVTVVGPLLEEEAAALHAAFWPTA